MLRRVIAAILAGFLVTFAGAASSAPSEQEQALVIVNKHRANQGRSALRLDDRLNGVADRLAYACARSEGACDHTTGGSLTRRLRAAGYRAGYAAENLRKNEATMAGAFRWWMASQVHNSNMLMRPLEAMGFAHRVSAKGRGFWVVVLAD